MLNLKTRLFAPIVHAISSKYRIITSKLYIVRKSYYKMVDQYNTDLKKELTNEGVYHYISNVNKLPKVSYTHTQNEQIRELTVMVNKNTNISEDLKAQLRLVLKSKGLKNI